MHDLAVDRVVVSPKNVFYNEPKAEDGIYVIIDGEHRWKAAEELGWDSIPCEIRNLGEELSKAMSYRRNKERGNIDPIKEAALFKSEIDQGLTQDAVARKYNVSRPYVANRLGLVQLGEKVVEMFHEPEKAFKETQLRKYQEALEEWKELQNQEERGYSYMSEPEEPSEEDFVTRGTLSASHLEVMATLPKEKQVELAETVLERDVTVRETEGRVKRIKNDLARESHGKGESSGHR